MPRMIRTLHIALAGLACTVLGLAQGESDLRTPPKSPLLTLLEADLARSTARAADPSLSEEQRATANARSERMGKILAAPKNYRAQILLGEIVDKDGHKTLERTAWRADSEYVYPASTVKLCGVVAALERVNDYRRRIAPEFSENTPIAFHPLKRGGSLLADDPDNLDGGKITVAHAIREVLLVSDNDSFNRLYEFCGQDWINDSMWRAGISSARIAHRLSIQMSTAENKRTPIVELRLPSGALLVEQRSGTKDLSLNSVPEVYVGERHMQGENKVGGPMSFFYKNRIGLYDLQTLLARIVRPDLEFEGAAFDISEAQRALVIEALKTYPGDSQNPRYDRTKFPDDYAKFFLPGLTRVIPKAELELSGKVGLGYGFALDTSYVLDKRSGRGFFLVAAIYADSDGTVNDEKYDYESVALPWLADVAEIVASDVLARAK